jgi:N-acetylglucosaminyldiphosphoundecaprenol N-acetyl-beta-D-mannosaminyltransferase
MNFPQANILGCKLHLASMEQCLNSIAAYIESQKTVHVITLNAEIVYRARSNPALQKIINEADLVTADGIGVVWGARFLGYAVPERVTGIDLMLALAARSAQEGWPLYLLGAAPGVAEEAARMLHKRYPGLSVCGLRDGYFTPEQVPAIIADINKSSPRILFVALGAPKQEFWIREHCGDLAAAVHIGVGGSLDVVAGIKKRAPAFFIKLNLEWLYRLLTEPSRFKRQLILPLFVTSVIRERMKRSL